MLAGNRRCSPPGSCVAAESAPGRSMAGQSWRDTPSGSPVVRAARHRWAAVEAHTRVSAADCTPGAYRLAALRLVAYRLVGDKQAVALVARVEHTQAAAESAALAESAVYRQPSAGVDRLRAIAPAAARLAAYTCPAAQPAAWPRVVCLRVAYRRPCPPSPRAAGSMRAGWVPRLRWAADSMWDALARQWALPEEPSDQPADPVPPRMSAAARSEDTWRRQGQAVVDGNEDSSLKSMVLSGMPQCERMIPGEHHQPPQYS